MFGRSGLSDLEAVGDAARRVVQWSSRARGEMTLAAELAADAVSVLGDVVAGSVDADVGGMIGVLAEVPSEVAFLSGQLLRAEDLTLAYLASLGLEARGHARRWSVQEQRHRRKSVPGPERPPPSTLSMVVGKSAASRWVERNTPFER